MSKPVTLVWSTAATEATPSSFTEMLLPSALIPPRSVTDALPSSYTVISVSSTLIWPLTSPATTDWTAVSALAPWATVANASLSSFAAVPSLPIVSLIVPMLCVLVVTLFCNPR